LQKFRITIKNFDDQPLTFEGVTVRGPNYRLISRFDDTENLYLCYGNKQAKSPLYDIAYFKDKIPNELHQATLDEAIQFPVGSGADGPFFKNKWWLWGIMIFVIVLLGTFTLRMLKEGK